MAITKTGTTLYCYPKILGSGSQVPNLRPAAALSAPYAIVQLSAGNQTTPPMGSTNRTPSIAIWEGDDATLRARLVTESGQVVLRDDVDSVSLFLFDATSASGPETRIHEEELDTEDVLEEALVLDGGWRNDTEGYSFKHTIDGDLGLFQGGRIYRAEYVFRTTDHGKMKVVGSIRTKSLSASVSEL